jgi:hypothetical protein
VVTGLAVASASAETHQVGPGRSHTQLSAVAELLAAGDVVELDGDATYEAVTFENHGNEAQRITIRGLRVNDRRPVISGGDYTVILDGDFYTLEDLEITGGTEDCVVHRAHGTIIRDSVIHDCPRHGILGTDADSGSLLLEYVEVYEAGSEPAGENLKHPIYIATDSATYPGAVFRMQHSYVHHSNGGNSVKSRAERAEIYYNWIEGAQYYELELIGPDGSIPAEPPREDADVVGNVLVQTDRHTSDSYAIRLASDLSGETAGRYRFVNNLIVVEEGAAGAMRCAGAIESVELHNNAFVHLGGTGFEYAFRRTDCEWTGEETIVGARNWYPEGTTEIPPGLTETRTAADPGLTDLAGFDFRPLETSPLVDAATSKTDVGGSFAFPDPEILPEFVPPVRAKLDPGRAIARMTVEALDIGPFEFGQSLPEPGDGGGGAGGGGIRGACGCQAGGRGAGLPHVLLALLILRLRRRPR